jgi:hypothetical protein
LIAALALVLHMTSAQAEECHHAARGTGRFIGDNDFVSEGIAAHLGPFDRLGNVQFGETSDPTAPPITGWAATSRRLPMYGAQSGGNAGGKGGGFNFNAI